MQDTDVRLSAAGSQPLAATGAPAAARPSGAGAKDAAASTATAQRQHSPRARLTYDPQEATVYVEILNPRTGDVIQRLPPERATGAVLRATDRTTGAVVDAKA